MPPIINGSYTDSIGDINRSFAGQDLGYKYPYELDLRPGHRLHDAIVGKIMQKADDSHSVMKKRHPVWNANDQILTAYIPVSEYEKKLKKDDPNKPISIVLPFSYAAMETILSYETKTFLSGPMFQYEGQGPEDTIPAKLLELAVNQQVRRYKSALDVHTGFRDGLAYGFHASSVSWAEEWGKKPVVTTTPQFTSMGRLIGEKHEKSNVPALLFEGNKVTPIDPYRCLPDTNVSIHKMQDGEFFGWVEDVSYYTLLMKEASGEGFFNSEYLKIQGESNRLSSRFATDLSKREKEGSSRGATTTTKYLTLVHMYVEIIPREWGLPGDPSYNKDGLYPEKWSFSIANDTILVYCAQLGLNHNRFPVAFNSPDYDGYSSVPVSRMEMNYGLQEVLNWTFNSHIANVRKAIHDMFVVDPSLISMTDLQNPSPGKYLRLRRSAWGRGVDNAIKQLDVKDITRGNMADAGFVMDMMQKAWATPDAGMGVMRGGSERRSAAEFNGTFGAHISRLEHLARITSLQYMHDLAYLHASHTQQLLSEETYVRAIGDWPQVLMDEYGKIGQELDPRGLNVSPFDIIADFDIITKDGSDQYTDSDALQFWTQTLPVLMRDPRLFQVFDITRIFKHIARISGEKNVNDFIMKGGAMQAQIIGNEQALIEKANGNLIPLPQGGE